MNIINTYEFLSDVQEKLKAVDPEKIKIILRKYSEKDIEFNEPHFSLKLEREGIDRLEVIRNLMKPDKLVLVGVSRSKNPNYEFVYDLYFKLSNYRVFKVPTSIKSKSLYLITIFKIRTRLQYEAIKYFWK